jgi:hypothetical protein
VGPQPDLLEVVGALDPVGRLPDFLDGGEQQSDQNADDGDDDQQLDERERRATSANTEHDLGPRKGK